MNREIEVKILRWQDAPDVKLPAYETEGSACLDLRVALVEPLTLYPAELRTLPTGIAAQVPEGYCLEILPRSGLASKYGISVVNSPGIIDSDYTGQIYVIIINHGDRPLTISPGDRICQMRLSEVVRAKLVLVDKLDETERNTNGIGSTGRS